MKERLGEYHQLRPSATGGQLDRRNDLIQKVAGVAEVTPDRIPVGVCRLYLELHCRGHIWRNDRHSLRSNAITCRCRLRRQDRSRYPRRDSTMVFAIVALGYRRPWLSSL